MLAVGDLDWLNIFLAEDFSHFCVRFLCEDSNVRFNELFPIYGSTNNPAGVTNLLCPTCITCKVRAFCTTQQILRC